MAGMQDIVAEVPHGREPELEALTDIAMKESSALWQQPYHEFMPTLLVDNSSDEKMDSTNAFDDAIALQELLSELKANVLCCELGVSTISPTKLRQDFLALQNMMGESCNSAALKMVSEKIDKIAASRVQHGQGPEGAESNEESNFQGDATKEESVEAQDSNYSNMIDDSARTNTQSKETKYSMHSSDDGNHQTDGDEVNAMEVDDLRSTKRKLEATVHINNQGESDVTGNSNTMGSNQLTEGADHSTEQQKLGLRRKADMEESTQRKAFKPIRKAIKPTRTNESFANGSLEVVLNIEPTGPPRKSRRTRQEASCSVQ
jgi:hypothetical protein